MSFVTSASLWIRQTLSWSNTWSSWQERLTLALFAFCGAGLFALSILVWLWQSTLGWTVLLILLSQYLLWLVICTRLGWLKLFGPVLFYDMICSARRTRYFVMRLLYANFLLAILCMMYLVAFEARGMHNPDQILLAVIGFLILTGGAVGLFILLLFLTSRRARILVLASIGVLTALLIVGVIFFDMSFNQQAGGDDLDRFRISQARLGETFFSYYMLVQMGLVVLLTPAYVAGSIAEEKERRTLEFLLATDLLNHEIILSKLMSRLANLTLFLLTGLPILSVLQFIGGVDMNLLIAGFAGTGLTMLGVASVSILFSTLFKKPRDAIGVTYLMMITYIAIGTVAMAFDTPVFTIMQTPIWFGEDPPTLGHAAHIYNSGNPATAIIDIVLAINGRSRANVATNLTAELPGILARYTWFHLPLAVICVIWSIARLRAVALRQTTAGTTQKLPWFAAARTALGEEPMLWKELYIENKPRATWIVYVGGSMLVLLTLGTGVGVLGTNAWDMLVDPFGGHRLTEEMNHWFRIAGTGVASLMMLMVGVRASTSITNERERDTFDALLTTPLSAERILAAKLIGSVTSLRMAWLWFGSMVALALLTGGVHPLAVPIVVTAWFVYAVFFAMIGLWFSMACQSSMRATVLTVLTTLFCGGGHWIVWLICCLPFMLFTRFDHPGRLPEYLAKFQLGLTPPFVIGFCSYSWRDLQRDFMRRDEEELFVFSLIGLFLWAMGCLILWYGLLVPKFKQVTRREEMIYEDEDTHRPHEPTESAESVTVS